MDRSRIPTNLAVCLTQAQRTTGCKKRHVDQKTQIALTKRVFAHLDKKTTDTADAIMSNPVASYASTDRLAGEIQKLFRREPLLMTMSCHIPEPGDYVTDDNTGVPILIVRGEDGRVRAFLNACPASRIAAGRRHRPGAQASDLPLPCLVL